MKKTIIVLLFGVFCFSTFAQNQSQSQTQDDYIRVLTERSEKIIKTLNITDNEKYNRIRKVLVDQYAALGKINDGFDEKVKAIKAGNTDKAEIAKKTDLAFIEKNNAFYNQRCLFESQLYAELSHEQVEAIKDGMTYNVMNVTYTSMLDMIPTLKDEEKLYIKIALREAREHAIDASSSDGKHAWFGKYKGRINNYLAGRGYDLKKEREGWNERLKAAKK